jgi:hypothetical protein
MIAGYILAAPFFIIYYVFNYGLR